MNGVEWSVRRRVAFRFASTYLVLYELPFFLKHPVPPGARPTVERLASFAPVVRWFGHHVLGVAGALPQEFGGGDSAFQWVRIAFVATVATATTIAWSLLDRRRTGYPVLFELVRLYVRYGLAFVMLFYGVFKLLPLQFEAPGLDRLLEPFGDASPMGLLWTFMGFSRPYTFFTGLVETLGAVLLLWRRTTLLGALILLGTLANVTVLNFTYDLNVKLRAIHLLLMAVFLVVPDAPTLVRLFLLGREARLPSRPSSLPGSWLPRARPWAKPVFVALCGWMTLTYARLATHPEPHPPRLFGVWLVEAGAPFPGQAAAWHRVVVNEWAEVDVERLDDTRLHFDEVADDPNAHRLTFVAGERTVALDYEQPDPDHLVLARTADRDVTLRLRREKREFLLTTRGFHWVQDAYVNR
jgi:hypothetical protein